MSILTPNAGIEVKNERAKLGAGYALDLIEHARAGGLSVDHRANVSVSSELLERLTLKADGLFERVEDTSTLPRFGIATVNAPALWAKLNLEADWRLSHTETLAVGYLGEAARLWSLHLPLGTANAFWGQVRTRASPRLELGVRYRLQLFASGSSPFANTHALSGSARYQLSRHSFALMEAGPMIYRASGKSRPFWTPRFNAEIGYDARGVELGVVAGHDELGAAGFATAIWADYLQVVAAWRASRRVSFLGGGGFFRNGLAPDSAVQAKGFSASAGAEWRFARGLAVSGTYDRISQLAQGDLGLGLSRNIVSVRLSYRMP
jgi:hypothetical protein